MARHASLALGLAAVLCLAAFSAIAIPVALLAADGSPAAQPLENSIVNGSQPVGTPIVNGSQSTEVPFTNSSAAPSQILNVELVYPMQGATNILVTITAPSTAGIDPVITDPSGLQHSFASLELGNGQREWTYNSTASDPEGSFTLVIHAPAGVSSQDVSLVAEFFGFPPPLAYPTLTLP